MSEIADKVKKIVVEHLGVEESKVTPEASFIDDLGADSLDTVELVMAFEEAFGVEIPEDAAEKISTVKDAIDYHREAEGGLSRPLEAARVGDDAARRRHGHGHRLPARARRGTRLEAPDQRRERHHRDPGLRHEI